VSAETVQGQGPKAALLIAAIEHSAFGVTGEENVFNLDIGRKLLAIKDPEEAADFLVVVHSDVHQQTAQLAQALIGGAGTDTELDRYLADMIARVNRQNRRVLGFFRDRGWLRQDVAFEELVETMAILLSVDTYLRVVHRDGWTADAYRTWCRRMLAETVFKSRAV
jgi:hypothetical protein